MLFPAIVLFFLSALGAVAASNTSKKPFAGLVKQADGSSSVAGVHANILIPKVSTPTGTSTKVKTGGQILLGLDTFNCSSPVTAGVQFSTQNNQVEYKLFYQWLSGPLVYVKNVNVKAGDILSVGINGDEYNEANPGQSQATIYFDNMSSRQNTTITTTKSVPTCGKNAVIIFEQLDNYALASFSKILASDAYFAEDFGGVLHAIALVTAKSYNLTNPAGKTLVTASDTYLNLNFTYVA